MNAYERASDALKRFLQDNTQRVFALKGPWGVGKSYFIREYIKNHEPELPPYVSFASLFGLRNIQEVRDIVGGCLVPTRHSMLPKATRKIQDLFKPKAAGFGMSVEIPNITTSVLWYLAKQHGVVIVLDDLERTHKELDLDQILGLASSLTENSKAKVLLILSETRLGDEQAATMQRYREKVIDVEHSFRPSTHDLVSKHLRMPKLIDAVSTCLEAGEGSNIRIIFKINQALAYFCDVAKKKNINYSDSDLSQIAKVVWLYYVSSIQVNARLIRDAWLNAFMGKTDDNTNSLDEQEVFRLAAAANLQRPRFSDLILEYLADGYFSEEGMRETIQTQLDEERKEEIDNRVREALSPLYRNFLASEEDVIAPLKKLLDDFAENLDGSQMQAYTSVLERFDVSTTNWWIRHLEAVVPTLKLYECQELLNVVKDPEAREIINRRLNPRTAPFDPRTAFIIMAKQQYYISEQIEILAQLDDSFYAEWFKEADGDLLETIQINLRVFGQRSEVTGAKALFEKLVRVLQQIGKENRLRRMQVDHVFASLHGIMPVPKTVSTGSENT